VVAIDLACDAFAFEVKALPNGILAFDILISAETRDAIRLTADY